MIRADPTRLGAGVLAGCGFLGAGNSGMKMSFSRGHDGGQSFWFGSVMGLAFGGAIFYGIVGTAWRCCLDLVAALRSCSQ